VFIASSAIIGTAGQALQILPPLSAVYGALPGPPAFCWDEQFGITTTGMTVNTIGNGFYTAPALFQSQYTVTGNQLHFDLWVGGASFPNRMSELRVFTESVPAPGAIGLLGFAGLVARRRRR
jgi:MYXO-CTERM domain-containing protein